MEKKEAHHQNWSATSFFENLTAHNKLAREKRFAFRKVSGLNGFEEAVNSLQDTTAFVCVSDISQGKSTLDNTPPTWTRSRPCSWPCAIPSTTWRGGCSAWKPCTSSSASSAPCSSRRRHASNKTASTSTSESPFRRSTAIS